MFKLLTIALLLAPVPALADQFDEMLHQAFREKDAQDRAFWDSVRAGEERAARMNAEMEAERRAADQQRALDSINMQLYQLNTR
jgi:hypothetical protein